MMYLDLYVVSIPHRYGKNIQEKVIAALLENGFPFLIGTVRTELGATN